MERRPLHQSQCSARCHIHFIPAGQADEVHPTNRRLCQGALERVALKQAPVTAVRIPSGLHLQSRIFAATVATWRRLGDFETSVLGDEIRDTTIDRPVYVTSLARSGTTILTEMLERHPALTCHRYSDFPNVWTPYWRNYLLQRTRRRAPDMKERAHGDRIRVSNDSPEAVEEVLWMHFFPDIHDPARSNVLDGSKRMAEFDRFYADHIRKLLAVRRAKRYLAKANYNLSRLGYILALFPDARFLVPIRDPVHHIASLMKQHELFTRADAEDPRVSRQLALSGHFEFGPGRRLVNFGDGAACQTIEKCWEAGLEAEGWARYWAATYRHLLQLLETRAEVREACLLFSYEGLCEHSADIIDAVLTHCELDLSGFENTRSAYCEHLRLPDYYRPQFNNSEIEAIQGHCGTIAGALKGFCHRAL
jgi:hypothetical protein